MDDSLFITDAVHERQITTPKGKVTIWLKELPNTAYIKFQAMLASNDSEARSRALPWLVSQALCEPNGEPAIDFDRACLLKVTVLDQLYRHATTLDKDDDVKKDSPPGVETGSGTPSP